MVITNGEIRIVQHPKGGYVDGVPVEGESTLMEAVPCNITGSRRRDNTDDEVSYTSAQYEVIIDNNHCMIDMNTECRLYNRRSCLGTFRVQDVQYLDYVDAFKLIVTRYAD